jgi:hypothetical protein
VGGDVTSMKKEKYIQIILKIPGGKGSLGRSLEEVWTGSIWLKIT